MNIPTGWKLVPVEFLESMKPALEALAEQGQRRWREGETLHLTVGPKHYEAGKLYDQLIELLAAAPTPPRDEPAAGEAEPVAWQLRRVKHPRTFQPLPEGKCGFWAECTEYEAENPPIGFESRTLYLHPAPAPSLVDALEQLIAQWRASERNPGFSGPAQRAMRICADELAAALANKDKP